MSVIAVLAGEGEYRSIETMRLYSDDQVRAGHRVEYRTPDVLDDLPEFPESSFGDLGILEGADLLVTYIRFRRLPDHEMEQIRAYLDRGRPVIGLRTSTHAFKFSEESPWAWWNDGFGRDVLGTPWVSHHAHGSTTQVRRIDGVEHPILEGLPDRFASPSWLYRVELAPDCEVLLWGSPVDSEEGEPEPGPVAWTRAQHRRTFATTLGHPKEFERGPLRRLLSNATSWCLE
jgi:hypothetical protein